MFIGTDGFVAWLEAIIYNKVRMACRNILVKIFVHLLGLTLMVLGIYFLITAIPSILSVSGLLLILIGLVIFLVPMRLNRK